jgi:hypothetical protein
MDRPRDDLVHCGDVGTDGEVELANELANGFPPCQTLGEATVSSSDREQKPKSEAHQ